MPAAKWGADFTNEKFCAFGYWGHIHCTPPPPADNPTLFAGLEAAGGHRNAFVKHVNLCWSSGFDARRIRTSENTQSSLMLDRAVSLLCGLRAAASLFFYSLTHSDDYQ